MQENSLKCIPLSASNTAGRHLENIDEDWKEQVQNQTTQSGRLGIELGGSTNVSNMLMLFPRFCFNK